MPVRKEVWIMEMTFDDMERPINAVSVRFLGELCLWYAVA
jgi:hypothetical protein